MRLLGTLLLILLVISPAGSQQPQKPESDQKQLATPYRGTEEVPFIVKTIPEDKSPDQIVAEEKKAELDRKTVELTGHLADYTWLLFLATGFLGIATITLAGVAFWQMVEARRSINAAESAANTAERALTVVERAFCAVKDLSNNTMLIQGQLSFFGVRIRITNSGRTPAIAYNARVNMVAIETVSAEFRFADYPGGRRGESVIGPQSETYLGVNIPIQDAVSAYEGKKRILVYGWLEYNDIFKDSMRHRTEFCFEFEFYTDPRLFPKFEPGQAKIPVFNIHPYERYNAYDGGCLYKPGDTPEAAPGELPQPTIPPGVTIAPPRT